MRDLSSFVVGETARIDVSLTTTAIDDFAHLSGDYAPIHMDDAFAQAAGFEARLVHGAHLCALVSRFVGLTLPGPSAILERMDLSFRAPCSVPAEISVEGKVRQISEAASSLIMEVTVALANGTPLATGKTWHKIHAASP